MDSTKIREKLHHYVDCGDEKLLKLMYAVAKEYSEADDFEYTFSNEEIALFEERRNNRISGKSKAYTWEEAKKIIIAKPKTDEL